MARFGRPKRLLVPCVVDFSDTPPSFLPQHSDFALASVGLLTRQRQRPDSAEHIAEQPAVQRLQGV
jgi:hypothetical protein